MAFYFGLNVNRNLSDISNPNEALKNINLDLKDLERIKGLTDPGGVTVSDFKSLSGLNVDLEKSIGSLNTETSVYNVLTSNFYDEYSLIDNNITINGQLAATAIKYRYLDDSNVIRIADISTSRVSSWSSFDSPVTTESPIFYGGQVDLEGTLELSSLTINDQATSRRFESEIPTHRIKVTVNNEEIYLLAMKGIPLTFRGFFRNATGLFASVSTLTGLPDIKPSWLIKNVFDSGEFVYENVLVSGSSQISFSDSSSKQRDISFYYPVDNITELSLPNITLITLPDVDLINLQFLDVSSNDLREFPNFSNFSNLSDLRIQNNDLTRSRNSLLKSFSSEIVSRIPASIRRLFVGNCFQGASTADLSSLSLIEFNCNAGGRINRRLSGISPAVNSSTIVTYSIGYNLFSDVDNSVKTSTSLKTIILDDNGFANVSDMGFVSQELTTFSSSNNDHNLVDLAGRPNLVSYVFDNAVIGVGNRDVENIFNGCSSLLSINLYSSNVNGKIPAFSGCQSLKTVDMRLTQVTDAVSSSGGNPPYVLGENTFASCRNTLTSFRVRSSNFSSSGEFHPDCFKLTLALSYIEISSGNVGITGSLPDFSTAFELTYLLLYNNKLIGNIPNFSNNQKLFFLNLSNNLLSGSVPNIPGSNFQHLILTNNQLDTFSSLDSANLIRIQLAYNNIKRIPDLSNLSRLRELLLNNQRIQPGDQMAYTSGSFTGLTAINNLNLTNNSISQGFIDQIILDLSKNYDNNPRRDVTINLRGNAIPSVSEDVQSAIDKLVSVGWRILTE